MKLRNETPLENHRSVYVVEDDLELSTVIDRILKSINPAIQSNWATSAEDAIHALKTAAQRRHHKPYDLIIADIFLEGESTGLDLWQLCHEHYPEVPLVITSGMDIERFMSSINIHDPAQLPPFLQKPFSIADCRHLLKEMLYPPKKSLPIPSAQMERSLSL